MFNKKYEISDPISLDEIRNFQRKHNLKLPSDYIFLLLHFNEFQLEDDAFGLYFNENNEEVTGLQSSICSLHLFEQYNIENRENAEEFYHGTGDKYYRIADLFFQGSLLIGHTPENQNKIYIDMPLEYDDVLFVADNFFDFINNVIEIKNE